MYTYFLLTITLGLIWGAIYLQRVDLRKEQLFASWIAFPLGLAEPLFVPAYWNPVSVLAYAGFDIESVLFTFFTGGIAATIYQEVSQRHLGHKRRARTSKHPKMIYGFVIAAMVVMALVHAVVPTETLHAAILLGCICALYLYMTRPDLTLPGLFGSVAFTVVYIGALLFATLAQPDFIATTWNPQALWGVHLLGIPIEEYLYALSFGILWAGLYEDVTNTTVA